MDVLSVFSEIYVTIPSIYIIDLKGVVCLMTLITARSAWLTGLLLASTSVGFLPGAANAAALPGPLYKLASAPTVYVEHGGSLHAIASPAMLYDLGYTWSDLTTVTILPAPVGRPVDLVKLANTPKVYLYQNGQMHWVESGKVFDQNGFQWANVYAVSKLPSPLGAPLTGIAAPSLTVPPAASYVSLSSFPYIPAGGTKTLAIDALTTTGAIDTTYNGTLTVLNPTDDLTFKNTAGTYVPGPVSISFTNGVGLLNIKAGPTTGDAALEWNNSGIPGLTILPNNTSQIGWRVFTTHGLPVSSIHPITGPTKVLIEPVDAAGAIVPATLADNVALDLSSQAPYYQDDLSNALVGGTPSFTDVYAASTAVPYTFTGDEFGGGYIGVSPAYPATIGTAPDSAVNAKVTAVIGPSSTTAPVVSNPVSNNFGEIQTQLVTGIQPDQTYSIQLQLETDNNQPILGLFQLLGQQAYPTSASGGQMVTFSISTGGRATPSRLTYGHLGANHVYLTYHSGSANNVPDALSLFGTQNEQLAGNMVDIPIVQLITNAF